MGSPAVIWVLQVGLLLRLLTLLPQVAALAFSPLIIFHALGRASLVPIGDPYLAESLHYHQ